MKLTRHNGRAGKNGVYNPKHNDRQFDLTNADHIDAARERQNIYWDCFQGFWIYRCAESACPVFWKSPVQKEEIAVPDRR